MGSSDSESENECFESAEESLDEEKDEKKSKLKKNLQKSGKEDSKPVVVSDSHAVDSVSAAEGDTSGSSLSYRKRPERVKRLPSRTQTKPTPKPPTNELIFKADKIVPDVFLQDITSNLSKNINKSLSTLQQKSSNVKDLILNSLPVSSVSESGGFSYDDKSVLPEDDNKALEPESKHQNSQVQENIKNNKAVPVCETFDAESDLVAKSRENVNDNEKKSEDVENIAADENFKEECSSACLSVDTLAEDNCTEAVNIETDEQEVIEDINEGNVNSEILAEDEKIDNLESVSTTEETDQKIKVSEKSENVYPEPKTSEEVKENENVDPHTVSDKMKNENNEDNTNLSNVSENNLNHVIEEKTSIDNECNLEELKTVLKNIVNEEKASVEDKEINESSNDGWDDFDFSDDEVENSNAGESFEDKGSGDTKINNELAKNKSENIVESREKIKPSSIGVKSPASSGNTDNVQAKGSKVFEKAKLPENNIVDNDSWDWDNWDEIPENKAVENIKNGKKDKGDSLDVSKWSGWDTFGQKQQEKQDNWGLGSWGVDALLNKATAVTQGISSVLEAGLGAPDPETLARMEKFQRDNTSPPVRKDIDSEMPSPSEISKKNSLTNVNIFPVSGITSLVAGVTSKIVEHSKIQEIGTKVITGGLETLETFGKKTMEVLQEGDPGLKNKRALLLGNNKPVLSQVLKEAREKADRESKKAEEKELAKKCHFETLFDDFQGMVHLEALEMLSRQCELKLDQIRSGMNSEEQEDLNGILEEVEQLCSLDEYDNDMKASVLDFRALLQMAVEPLKNEISIQNIIQIHEDVNKWLQTSSETQPSFTIINQKLVSTLAELTAATVHQFHKSGELLSVKECRKTVEEVDALSRLTNALCSEINKLGEKFIKLSCNSTCKDNSGDNLNSFNDKVNNVMKNSVFYIKQAFNLLIPVIQLGAAV